MANLDEAKTEVIETLCGFSYQEQDEFIQDVIVRITELRASQLDEMTQQLERGEKEKELVRMSLERLRSKLNVPISLGTSPKPMRNY